MAEAEALTTSAALSEAQDNAAAAAKEAVLFEGAKGVAAEEAEVRLKAEREIQDPHIGPREIWLSFSLFSLFTRVVS